VLVNDLRPSTMSYSLIDLGNKIARDHIDIDFYVFNQDWQNPPHTISFPLLQQKNIWGFHGTLISTNLDTTQKLLVMPNTAKKLFYVWNIFEYQSLPNAKHVYDIYQHPDLTLIGRSVEYSSILQNNFNQTVQTLEDFNYGGLLEIIRYRKS